MKISVLTLYQTTSQQKMNGDFVSIQQGAHCALFSSYQDCFISNRPYPRRCESHVSAGSMSMNPRIQSECS